MLDKLRIGPKLLLAPTMVLLLLILSSASAWYGMVRQNTSMENMVQVRMAHLKAALDVAGDARYAHGNMYQLLSWTNGSFARARLDALEQQIKQRHGDIAKQLSTLRATSTGAELSMIDGATSALAAYRKAVLETLEMAQMDLSIAANSMIKADSQFGQLNTQLGKLAALETALSTQAHAAAVEQFHSLGWTLLVTVLLSIAVSVLATFLVRRAMLTEIRGIAEAVQQLAAGQLTPGKPKQGSDEIAATSRVLDQSIAKLNQTLRTIQSAVQSIDTASHEIAVGNMDLSARTEMQASSLEQTSSAMETLTEAVNDNAGNARRACELAAQASSLAVQGGVAMQQAVTTMATIDGGSVAVQQAGDSMGAIVASVQQVNDIIQRVEQASAEQASGITEVNQAVAQMDDVTQQNAALVEQAAAAAASLQEQAVTLSAAVAVFTLDQSQTVSTALAVVAAPEAFQDTAGHAERRAVNSPLRGNAAQAARRRSA